MSKRALEISILLTNIRRELIEMRLTETAGHVQEALEQIGWEVAARLEQQLREEMG